MSNHCLIKSFVHMLKPSLWVYYRNAEQKSHQLSKEALDYGYCRGPSVCIPETRREKSELENLMLDSG